MSRTSKPITGIARTDAPLKPPPVPWRRLISSVSLMLIVLVFMQIYSSRRIATVLRSGVEAHVVCAMPGKYPTGMSLQSMAIALGALAPILQPVLNQLPQAELIATQQCSVHGRNYFQVLLRVNGSLASILLSRRADSETLPRSLLGRTDQSSGVNIHEDDFSGYRVAGFILGEYVGYVVSALPQSENLALATGAAPVLKRYTQARK